MLHIDLPSRTDVEKLAQYQGAPAVSLYLATTPLTEHVKADRIELKNLLKEAVAQLQAAGTEKRSIWPIEEHVNALIENDDFWVYQANSLAIFATPSAFYSFRLPNKLTNTVEVSDRFHLKPLLRALTFPHHAYVLALSVGAVRLIEVTADLPPRLVSVPGLPRDAASALGRSTHLDKDGPGRSGEETSEHALLLRYARAVDHALRPLFKGESAPLIVAATEPMASIYRSASSYPYVAEQVLAGNAEHLTDAVLAAEARKVLDQIYAQEIAALKQLFEARAVQGRATADIAQAARAATFGAVDTLIVDMDVTVSGYVDADGKVAFDATPDAANYGIGDEIVRRVLQAGGRVIAARRADVPQDADVAAILRYPL